MIAKTVRCYQFIVYKILHNIQFFNSSHVFYVRQDHSSKLTGEIKKILKNYYIKYKINSLNKSSRHVNGSGRAGYQVPAGQPDLNPTRR